MICEKCGNKNTKNANYCNKCGNNLKEENNKESEKTNSFITEISEDVKGIFVKPITTIKAFVENNNFMQGLLYLGINIIVMALLVLITLKSLYINTGFQSLMFNFNTYDVGFNGNLFPFFRIFLLVIISQFLIYVILSGIIYGLIRLCNGLINFKNILCWLGINSLFSLITNIIIGIFMIVSVKLGTILFLLASIVFIYNTFKTINYITDTDENKLGYILATSLGLTTLIVLVLLPIILY